MAGAFQREEIEQLAIDVWHVLRDYIELLASVFKNIFLDSGIGQSIMNIANIGCELVNDVINAVKGLLHPVCTLVNLNLNIGFVHINFGNLLGGLRDSSFCNFDTTQTLACNAKFEAKDQSRAMEANVCLNNREPCEYCVFHTPDECGDNLSDNDYIFGKPCRCNNCKYDYSCDGATGMCVCGLGSPIIQQDQNDCDARVVKHEVQYDVIRNCISNNPVYHDGLCPVLMAWSLVSSIVYEGQTASERLETLHYIMSTTISNQLKMSRAGEPGNLWMAGERLCSTYCSMDPRNERNELITLDIDDETYVACALGVYTGLSMDSLKNFDATQSSGRRLLQTAYPANSYEPVAYSNYTTVWSEMLDFGRGSNCSMHAQCYAPEALCLTPSGSLGDMVPCASCRGTLAGGRAMRSCHAATSTCVCGAGWEDDAPRTREMPQQRWEVYSPFMRVSEWPGTSRCDILARAYIDIALERPEAMTALERVELAGCMQRKTYAMHARDVTGVPTLPLDMFYDPYSTLNVARDVFIAALVARPANLTESDEAVWQFWSTFDAMGVDPILGMKVSDKVDRLWAWLYDNAGARCRCSSISRWT